MDVWRVKLDLKEARRGKVPFSLFYLFPGSRVETFRRTFETFIGFPARHTNIAWDRVRIHMDDTGADTFLTQVIRDLRDPAADWHVAVPILSLNTRPKTTPPRIEESPLDLRGVMDLYKQLEEDEDTPRPAYITERTWSNWKARMGVPTASAAYPPTSYFVTRDDTFVPPCMACPRIGYHEAGECHLGDPICYVSLRYYKASARMFEKLRDYDNLQETIDGLPKDELHSTEAIAAESALPSDAD